MTYRSRSLVKRLRPHLPATGLIADVGSGTGHNAEAIRRLNGIEVHEFDVADLHWVGPGPQIFDKCRLPAEDGSFESLLLLFVLQYPDSPSELLKECRRVSRGPTLVVQSTFRGTWGRTVLAVREFFWGRAALRLAVLTGLVHCAGHILKPRRFFTVSELHRLFDEAGFVVVNTIPAEWFGLCVSRDLFILQPRKR